MKLRMPLLAAALLVAVSGCAALPTSGGVQTGNVIDTETQVQGVFQPIGPQPGSKPQVIVTDFIQAALDPQNDYATAREFLTGDEQQKWNPNFSVSIQQGTGSFGQTADPSHLTYSTSVVASIDATGAYTEEPPGTGTGPVSFGFDLVKVKIHGKDQWRISTLNDGVIISESTFDSVYAAHPLYFFEPSYTYLVPDVRWFPTTDGVTTRIANSLLAGPAKWLSSGVLVTAFPPGTTLDDVGVMVDSAVATVELSSEAKQNTSSRDRARMLQEMTASLTSVSTVQSVDLTVGGVDLAPPGAVAGPPSVQPSVNAASLVLEKSTFGFTTGEQVRPLSGLSDRAVSLGMRGATYADASQLLAVRTDNGVAALKPGTGPPVWTDTRPHLIDPTLDNYGFVWSVQSDSGSKVKVVSSSDVTVRNDLDLTSALGGDARVVSLEVSRDGARLLVYADGGENGQRLIVAGIIRGSDNRPTGLEPDAVSLPVSSAQPVDATWESDRAVATISGSGAGATVTEFVIGGPSTVLGFAPGAKQIVGGNAGQTGLRVINGADVVLRGGATGSMWREAGYSASFIATQQPG